MMDRNSNISDQSSRQHSNESIKEDDIAAAGAGSTTPKIPFRANHNFCGRYPIGVIPPYYVNQNGNIWTPPDVHHEHVFKFPPNYDLLNAL
uniref:Uncharacterized protein n=1 Tax=Panagrolaimus superbus TaxID=310955 RepID=A0A914YTP6_9BILA